MSSFISCSSIESSGIIVFQCFLLQWYPGIMFSYCSRSSVALSGSHLRLKLKGIFSVSAMENILPLTLKTMVVSSKGKSLVAAGLAMQ